MNKEELNQRLTDLENEAEKLRSLINALKEREPEEGDVWKVDGLDFLVGDSQVATSLRCGYTLTCPLDKYFRSSTYTYLGKFDEVYVKISDVRDALRLRVYTTHCEASPDFEALRKLNILD